MKTRTVQMRGGSHVQSLGEPERYTTVTSKRRSFTDEDDDGAVLLFSSPRTSVRLVLELDVPQRDR